jgi:hypothetical protein
MDSRGFKPPSAGFETASKSDQLWREAEESLAPEDRAALRELRADYLRLLDRKFLLTLAARAQRSLPN